MNISENNDLKHFLNITEFMYLCGNNSAMNLDELILAFTRLGKELALYLTGAGEYAHALDNAVKQAVNDNYWFTEHDITSAIGAIAEKMLAEQALRAWAGMYPELNAINNSPANIGLIMAGNIPLVGFHDLLCVLVSGNKATIKPSSKDNALIGCICDILSGIEPRFENSISFTGKSPEAPDAVIATGSNNTSRYFETAYSDIPRIIRGNRYSVAILAGDESPEELIALGKDVFTYFGLGCRNVSRLLVPEGYDFGRLFDAIAEYSDVMKHKGYNDCYRYKKAVLDLHEADYLTNGFVLLTEQTSAATSLASVSYAAYSHKSEIAEFIATENDKIQCVVSGTPPGTVRFGATQSPEIYDYADNVDTMRFLLNSVLKCN